METYYKVSVEVEEIEIDDRLRVSYRTIEPPFPLDKRFETETAAVNVVTKLVNWGVARRTCG